ncbi:hypothetical protein Avbf_00275 [Armadillidium vulgare]|nr:hypothetical protein Avbf_00275 [Armadillidium vulgare]
MESCLLKEAGIITHWLSPIMSKSSECLLKSAKKPNQLRPLVLVDLYGTFSLFIGGIILSTISFLVEVFFLKSK